jgi:L-fuconolactonase
VADSARQVWRDQVIEPALEPDLPIIDAHHHFVPVAHRPRLETCLPEAFLGEIGRSGHKIVATVHVDAFSNYRASGPEPLRVVGETEYVDEVAQADGVALCAAIVGGAELMLGSAVGEVLDAHLAASDRFRGVRRMTIFDADTPQGLPARMEAGLLARPEFREGMREVARRGLSFDAGVFQSQLPELADFARAFPDTTIVLGHIGVPMSVGRYAARSADAFADWRSGMAELAMCENVVVKIGGLNMPITGLGLGDDAGRPPTSLELVARQRDHVLTTVDLFGPGRCLFESNFPVDGWYVSYGVLWNTFKRLTHGFSPEERDLMFRGVAARVYRLDGSSR